MEWEVEYTDQFYDWWKDLSEEEQEDIDAVVRVLEQRGPALRRPHVGTITGTGSRHANMKELVVQLRSASLRDITDRWRQDRERPLVSRIRAHRRWAL